MNKQTDLLQTIKADTIAALKSGEKEVVAILRLVQSDINQLTYQSKPIEINDDAVQKVLMKMIKKLKESVEIFQSAELKDPLDKAQREITVLENYLPPVLDESTIETMIRESIEATGANSIKAMGQVIAHIKAKPCNARIDWQLVSSKVRNHLSKTDS